MVVLFIVFLVIGYRWEEEVRWPRKTDRSVANWFMGMGDLPADFRAILVRSSFNVGVVWDSEFEIWKCRGMAGVAMLGWRAKRETNFTDFSKTHEIYGSRRGAQ
jgi:hypothetical protein